MSNQYLDVLDKIKEEFKLSKPKKGRNLKIPSGIHLTTKGNSVTMELTCKAVSSNMQIDDGAFEGWALVLRRWGKYEKITIRWEKPNSIENGHYQRFLFRLKHFSHDFKSWFSVETECKEFLNDSKIKETKTYFLNKPDEKRGVKVSPKPEAQLEHRFVKGDLRKSLMDISNAEEVYRQLPVGLFEDSVSESSSIFTRGSSAIDIWGINKDNELLIFELKAPKNEKVGIISELYFYVCVMQNLRKQMFKHEINLETNKEILKIPGTKKIKSYFLAQTLHPLVDKEILRLLNEATHEEISCQYIQFNQECELTLDAFN